MSKCEKNGADGAMVSSVSTQIKNAQFSSVGEANVWLGSKKNIVVWQVAAADSGCGVDVSYIEYPFATNYSYSLCVVKRDGAVKIEDVRRDWETENPLRKCVQMVRLEDGIASFLILSCLKNEQEKVDNVYV